MAKRHDIQGDFHVSKKGVDKGSTSDWQEARKLAGEVNADSIVYMTPSGLTFEVGGFTGIPGSVAPAIIVINERPSDDSNEPYVWARIEHGMGKLYWSVMGPRVLRGGRVDHKQQSYYGTVELDGSKINNWKGRGAAGDYAKVYIEKLQYMLRGYYGPTKPGHHPPADKPGYKPIEHGKESPMTAKEEHPAPAPAPSHATPTPLTHKQEWISVWDPKKQELVRVPILPEHAGEPHASECACETCKTGPSIPTPTSHVHATPCPEPKAAIAIVKDGAEESPTKSACKPARGITKQAPDPRFISCIAVAKKIGPIDTSKKAWELIREALEKEDQEVLVLIPLNIQLLLKRSPRELHRGGQSRVEVDRRIVIGEALRANAAAFVIVHNHPSSVVEPSDADIALTKAIKKSANEMDLTFIDHLVIGRGGAYYSFADHGHM